MNLPHPLVTTAWLAQQLGSPGLVIIDCRMESATGDPEDGRRAYQQAHLPGAVYFHLDLDLSGPGQAHGGRHPLPAPVIIAGKLGAAGVGPGVKVVVYDDSGAFAARGWWVLRWLGHDEVALLDGGYSAWVKAGLPVSAEPSRPVPRQFTPQPRPELTATMVAVRERRAGEVLIDARAPERFAGQPHPLDPSPGHIPGAVNRFWQHAMRPDGTWKSSVELSAQFAGIAADADLIHNCGSGVTACANLVALEIAGRRSGRLYVGSWSDWCSYPENPLEK